MARIQQQDKFLSIHGDWFSLLFPGVWNAKAAQEPVLFEGTLEHRTLQIFTHTLPVTPNTELKTLALRTVLEARAKAENSGVSIEEGPVETSPGGNILTAAYSVTDSANDALARVKLVCYGRRCVGVRLSAARVKDERETLEALERDVETMLDGLSLLEFQRVPVAHLQRRVTWLLAVNLFLLCGALLVAAQCYWGGSSVDTSALRQKAQAIQDAQAGRAAANEALDFFDFWFDRAGTFRREIAVILVVVAVLAAANVATILWLRKIVRHPWDDIIEPPR